MMFSNEFLKENETRIHPINYEREEKEKNHTKVT